MCFVSRERMSARMQLYICAPLFLCLSCRDWWSSLVVVVVIWLCGRTTIIINRRALFVYFTRRGDGYNGDRSLTFEWVISQKHICALGGLEVSKEWLSAFLGSLQMSIFSFTFCENVKRRGTADVTSDYARLDLDHCVPSSTKQIALEPFQHFF